MDPEAQPYTPQNCAWSTIPVPMNRGTVLSRHDGQPIPCRLPCPEDTPPAYTYPPPISGSDPPAEFTANRTVAGHNLRLYAIVIAVILTVAMLATALFFSFFD